MKFWRYIILLALGVVIGVLLHSLYGNSSVMPSVSPQHHAISSDTVVATGSFGSVDDRLEKIDDVLREAYLFDDRIDLDVMKKRAIKSYVDALRDPFTVYLDAEENTELTK